MTTCELTCDVLDDLSQQIDEIGAFGAHVVPAVLRALIDAARRDMDYAAQVAQCGSDVDAITRNVDELRALNAPITRPAAFTLVERELRGMWNGYILCPSEGRCAVEVADDQWVNADTLLEAVDAAKGNGK